MLQERVEFAPEKRMMSDNCFAIVFLAILITKQAYQDA